MRMNNNADNKYTNSIYYATYFCYVCHSMSKNTLSRNKLCEFAAIPHQNWKNTRIVLFFTYNYIHNKIVIHRPGITSNDFELVIN